MEPRTRLPTFNPVTSYFSIPDGALVKTQTAVVTATSRTDPIMTFSAANVVSYTIVSDWTHESQGAATPPANLCAITDRTTVATVVMPYTALVHVIPNDVNTCQSFLTDRLNNDQCAQTHFITQTKPTRSPLIANSQKTMNICRNNSQYNRTLTDLSPIVEHQTCVIDVPRSFQQQTAAGGVNLLANNASKTTVGLIQHSTNHNSNDNQHEYTALPAT